MPSSVSRPRPPARSHLLRGLLGGSLLGLGGSLQGKRGEFQRSSRAPTAWRPPPLSRPLTMVSVGWGRLRRGGRAGGKSGEAGETLDLCSEPTAWRQHLLCGAPLSGPSLASLKTLIGLQAPPLPLHAQLQPAVPPPPLALAPSPTLQHPGLAVGRAACVQGSRQPPIGRRVCPPPRRPQPPTAGGRWAAEGCARGRPQSTRADRQGLAGGLAGWGRQGFKSGAVAGRAGAPAASSQTAPPASCEQAAEHGQPAGGGLGSLELCCGSRLPLCTPLSCWLGAWERREGCRVPGSHSRLPALNPCSQRGHIAAHPLPVRAMAAACEPCKPLSDHHLPGTGVLRFTTEQVQRRV